MSASTIAMEGTKILDKKTVSISSKRQITIPRKFFELLGFATEAECVVRGDELVIRPVRITSNSEFAENILEDLINSGVTIDNLLPAFKAAQAKIRPAVESMIAKADEIADGTGEYYSYDDIFNSEG